MKTFWINLNNIIFSYDVEGNVYPCHILNEIHYENNDIHCKSKNIDDLLILMKQNHLFLPLSLSEQYSYIQKNRLDMYECNNCKYNYLCAISDKIENNICCYYGRFYFRYNKSIEENGKCFCYKRFILEMFANKYIVKRSRMILYNKNIKDSILLYEYLSVLYPEKVLLKGNIVYSMCDTILENINDYIKLYNFNKHLYYYLNLNMQYNYIEKCNINIHEYNDNVLDKFIYRPKGFFPKGNTIIAYFSTDYISNPLDVLDNIVKKLNLKNKYASVSYDYIPYKENIIYYIMFRYSGDINSNLNEIKENISNINKIKTMSSSNLVFPSLQKEFEKTFLKDYPKINHDICFKYIGLSLYSAYIKEV